MGKAAKVYRRPCESRDPYAVPSRLTDAANCLCYNRDRWLWGPRFCEDDIDIDALILSYAPPAIAQRGMNVPCNPDPDIGYGKCRKTTTKR
jgi:hypothetical protein